MTAVFGELSDELVQKSKYAKWRAAYIIKSIKAGEKPLPPEDETKADQEANSEFNEPPAYNPQPGGQAIDDDKQDFDIGQPPAALNFNDFNLNQINNLTINSQKPSTVTPSRPATSNYSNPIDYSSGTAASSGPSQTLAAMNGIRISQDDILKAQKYSKWASSALDYEDVKTAVGNLQKALNILTRGRED